MENSIVVIDVDNLKKIIEDVTESALKGLQKQDQNDKFVHDGPYTLKKYSEMTGVSVEGLKGFIKKGLLPRQKLGGLLVVYQSEVRAAVERSKYG